MDELLSWILLALVFWLGWTFRGLVFLHRLTHRPQYFRDLIDQLIAAQKAAEQEDPQTAKTARERLVAVEHHDSMIYLWCQEPGQFMGQGPTLESALAHAQARWPQEQLRLVRADRAKEPSQEDCKTH